LPLQQDVYSVYVRSTHGYHELTAHTYNTKTGEELLLGDSVSIDKSQLKKKLTNELANSIAMISTWMMFTNNWEHRPNII